MDNIVCDRCSVSQVVIFRSIFSENRNMFSWKLRQQFQLQMTKNIIETIQQDKGLITTSFIVQTNITELRENKNTIFYLADHMASP